MSPEFKVEIVVPYTFAVEAENEEKAQEEAVKAFEDYMEEPFSQTGGVITSIEEIPTNKPNL